MSNKNSGLLSSCEEMEAWDGQGLPPVGIEIEALLPGLGWQVAKVVHAPLPEWPGEVLVFSLENAMPAWVNEFRPIRTPEQIAAEQREIIARALYVETFGNPASSSWERLTEARREHFRSMVKAGWRKQEESE